MFYSRPQIEPLGWDLLDWPQPQGTKHFEAFTHDRRPVDFWFSGGWLTVSRGPVDAPMDCPEMEEVLSRKIAPFGTMDIEPEQICDILGITINGHPIDSAGMRTGVRGFDWSGQTTYWESTHLMRDGDDAREFLRTLSSAFPESRLMQIEWGSHGLSRWRQIQFLMGSDELVTLGLDPDPVVLERMLAGEEVSIEDSERAFAFGISFSRRDRPTEDVTGGRFVYQNGGANLSLKYDVIPHRLYRLDVQFQSRDVAAQGRMKTLLALIDASFCRGLEVINLQTGAVVAEEIPDDADRWRYSLALRNEWRSRRERYFYVGLSVRGDYYGWEPGMFWGARPHERVA
jgi:hypothetical protein